MSLLNARHFARFKSFKPISSLYRSSVRLNSHRFYYEELPISSELDNLRTPLLFPGNEFAVKIFEANSIQQITNIVEDVLKSNQNLDPRLASQALLSIYDINKIINRYWNEDAFEEIKENETYQKILESIAKNCGQLDDSTITYCLLSLKKLNYEMGSQEAHPILLEILSRGGFLQKDFSFLSPDSLSRLFTSLKSGSLFGRIISCELFPALLSHLEKAQMDSEIRNVTISIRAASIFLSERIKSTFFEKVRALLQNPDQLESITMAKVFLALNDICLSQGRANKDLELVQLIYSFGKPLSQRLQDLEKSDLLGFGTYLDSKSGPPELVEALRQRISRLIEEEEDEEIKLELLACISPGVRNIRQRIQLGHFMENFLEHHFDPSKGHYTSAMIKVLRHLRSKNSHELYKKFWNTIEPNPAEIGRNLQLVVDYLAFYGGVKYRSFSFELKLKEIFYGYLRNYQNPPTNPDPNCYTVLRPKEFVTIFSFLIAFGGPHDEIFQIKYLNLMENFAPLLKIQDFHILARAVGVQLDFTTYKDSRKLLDISSLIEENCGLQFNPEDAAQIARILLLLHRENSPMFDLCLSYFNCKDVWSAREIVQSLISSNTYDVNVIANIEGFVSKVGHLSSPELAEKYMCMGFVLGLDLNPDNIKEGAQTIERCKGSYTTTSLLNCAVALCFYGALSPSLVNYIFSVEFIDQVDEDVSVSFGSGFSLRVRQLFMELNRAVCIEMPELDVPWFHEKYCDNMHSVNPRRSNYLHKEVEGVLDSIIGLSYVKKNTFSPYYYPIDFEINFDKDRRPIKATTSATKKKGMGQDIARKVAIQIISHPNAYTRKYNNLRGYYKLAKKHLEILGYKTLIISPSIWNSMYMAEPYSKEKFLEQIFDK